ncbi:putative PhoH family protein [Klebsiella phage CPRSA]|nr:putative PhoH family protein [Klebsiella phage CPRSA]
MRCLKGCPVLQYTGDDSLKDSDVLYSGYIDLPLFWETVEVLEYVGPVAVITYSSLPDADFYPNQYILSDGEIVGVWLLLESFSLKYCLLSTNKR